MTLLFKRVSPNGTGWGNALILSTSAFAFTKPFFNFLHRLFHRSWVQIDRKM